jgi:hypothetical protein
MLPPSLFKEVADADPKDMSFAVDLYQNSGGRYSHVGTDKTEFLPAIRHDLTKSIGDSLPLLQDEANYAFEHELGTPKDWTPIPLYPKVARLTALLAGRVFVGQPLNRDDEYLRSSINFTLDISAAGRESVVYHPMIREWVLRMLTPFPSVASRKAIFGVASQHNSG